MIIINSEQSQASEGLPETLCIKGDTRTCYKREAGIMQKSETTGLWVRSEEDNVKTRMSLGFESLHVPQYTQTHDATSPLFFPMSSRASKANEWPAPESLTRLGGQAMSINGRELRDCVDAPPLPSPHCVLNC